MFESDYTGFEELESCSYRDLQRYAKSINLPSNVKKMYLIEMIHAKKYLSDEDLKSIIDRIKMERKVNSQTKKKKPKRKPLRLQMTEVSSTSDSQSHLSPPITITPKRPSSYHVQYSPGMHNTVVKYQPRNILYPTTSVVQPMTKTTSDRVLRSYNSIRKPNYRIMNESNCVIDVVKARNTVQQVKQRTYQSVSVIHKHRPIMNPTAGNREHGMMPISGNREHGMMPISGNRVHGMIPISENREHGMIPISGNRELGMIPNSGNREHGMIPISGNREPTIAVPRSSLGAARIKRLMQNVSNTAERQMVPVARTANISPKPAKRQRKLSGIYPLSQEEPYYNYTPTVTVRCQDGRVTKINAIIQKTKPNIISMKNRSTLTVQDLINFNLDKQNFAENNEVSIDNRTRNMEPNLSRNMYNAERHIQNKTAARLREQNLIINAYNNHYVVTNSNDYQFEYERYHTERERELTTQRGYKKEVARPGQEMAQFGRNVDYSRSIADRYTDGNGSGLECSRPEIIDLGNALRFNDREMENENRIDYSRPDVHFNQNTRKEGDLEYSRQNVVVLRNPESFRDSSPREDFFTNPSSPTVITNNTDRNLCRENPDYSRYENKNQNSDLHDIDDAKVAPQYPNMAAVTDVSSETQSDYSVYYHKKIRSEQVRHKAKDARLPHINDAFNQFNRKQRSPLRQRMERDLATPQILAPSNTCMLESLYNFKNDFVTNPPVFKIATTDTYSTYSTKTIATAMAYPSPAELSNTTYERPSLFQDPDLLPQYEYLKPDGRSALRCDEELGSSILPLETNLSQELGANVTIPPSVEDALELISQDGDYMERIGMDVRVQCVLCDWAGPKIILEYHVKKDHHSEIQIQDNKDWSILVALSSLISHRTWYSQLIQHKHTMYVLSAKYGEQDTLMIALSTIPSELDNQKHYKITIYNKVSGKPYIFEGELRDLPDSMPYEYTLECLSVDIANLDLIPNTANLTLVNRELVVNSPIKPVVGRELQNVEIVVYVKILD